MVRINFATKAKADLREINYYYLQQTDESTTERVLETIRQAIIMNATITVSEGNLVKGTRYTTYRWLIYNKKYHVYYRRQRNGIVRILRIYGTARRPLRSAEIGS